MKLIEKKCPNCGAGLKFDKDDTEVVCEYCKKSYIIQRDHHEMDKQGSADDGLDKTIVSEYYNLIQKRNNGVKAIVAVIFVIIFFSFILTVSGMFEMGRKIKDGMFDIPFETGKTKENYVTSFEEIDEKSLEIIHKDSLKKLNNQRDFVSSNVVKSDWTYVGMYLLINKDDSVLFDGNALYDVYKSSYTGEKVNMDVYAAVRYEDLKLTEEGKVITSYNGHVYAPMLFINGGKSSFVNGYESNEELFNKVIRNKMDKYTILNTEGMYMES